MRQTIINLGDGRVRGTHPGLMLQRYLINGPKQDVERRILLDATRQAGSSESLKAVYAEAFARWVRSFPEDGLHRSEQLTTAGRLIVGLGSENVLETGLRLHHTYGVPIIPGSALKGLASHYCHDIWGQRNDRLAPAENQLFQRGGDHHKLFFGTTEDGGVITFHDAWIIPESLGGALRLDVMTPHHPKWQMNQAPPTDFDSPVPVPFLSVAGTFNVRISWSGPAGTSSDRDEAWTALAMRLLQEALAEWGVGGKTNSGYGRLAPINSVQSGREPESKASARSVAPPKQGETVDVLLLPERTKKGGWRALHERSGLSGNIENTGDVPADKNPGDKVSLIVKSASASGQGLTFRYPTADDEARAHRAPRKGPTGSGRGNRKR